MALRIPLLVLFSTLLIASGCVSTNSFFDVRDNQQYKIVEIGEQIWFAENLNYNVEKGFWCYENNESYCQQYGKLYTWESAKVACPSGWHLPSYNEWMILLDYYPRGSAYDSLILNGSSGFNILMAGQRSVHYGGSFRGIDELAHFWTSSEVPEITTGLCAQYLYLGNRSNRIYQEWDDQGFGFSVRCVKDR